MGRSPALASILADDFPVLQQEIIHRAFREAVGMLGIRARGELGRLVAVSITGAVRCGCLKHGELVAVGLATARGVARQPDDGGCLPKLAPTAV